MVKKLSDSRHQVLFTINVEVSDDSSGKTPNSTRYVGPYGAGVSHTEPVSEPPSKGNYIGPYGAGVDQNDR